MGWHLFIMACEALVMLAGLLYPFAAVILAIISVIYKPKDASHEKKDGQR